MHQTTSSGHLNTVAKVGACELSTPLRRGLTPACEVAVLVCSIDLSHVAIFFSDATAAGAAAARTLLRQGRICRRCLLYRQRLLTCKKFGQRCPRLRRPSGPAPPAHALSPSTPLPPPPCPPVCRFEMSRCVCPPRVEGCAREGCVRDASGAHGSAPQQPGAGRLVTEGYVAGVIKRGDSRFVLDSRNL